MLHINDLTFRLGERILFDHTGFVVPAGAKVGIVGRNGTGKTTLFRILLNELSPESGSFRLPRGVRIGTVAQEAPSGEETLLETVLASDIERANLLQEAEHAEGMRRADIEMRLEDIGAYSAPARAATILHGLGFNEAEQQRPCSSFSGGWRMRVALAAILFVQPELLLLDEPTNYLDLEGTLWLYNYLERYPYTVIIISHDRELLDTCVDHIVHLEQAKFTMYRGGYSSFSRQHAEKKEISLRMRARQDAERKHLQSFIDRFRAKATKARQAQSRIKRLEKLEPVSLIIDEGTHPFTLKGPERPLSPPLMVLESVSVGYSEKTILRDITLNISPDDRIALIGANGNGKSTFCKLLANRLSPQTGIINASQKLKVGYFAQHQIDELSEAQTPYEHMALLMPPGATTTQIRTRTAQIGFSGLKADTPVTSLSGGEKARLVMGLVAFNSPDLLILDEPTNHLDIDSRTALMEAINDYSGAVLLVSHDTFLIEACVDRLWLIANGKVTSFDGDIEDYKSLVLSVERNDEKIPSAEMKTRNEKENEKKNLADRRSSLVILRKQRDTYEERMRRLEAAILKIDLALSDGTAFQKDSERAGELARKRTEAAQALAELEDRWLDISSQIDDLSGRK